MAGGPGGRLGPRRGPAAEPLAGVRGQRPLKPLDFSNFKGQGNTIFILKIDVLKVQTGSVAKKEKDYKKKKKKKKKKKSKIGTSRFLAVLKVVNRDG